MEKSKSIKDILDKILHNYLVFKSFIAVTFFVIAYVLFIPLLNTDSDWLKILLASYGIFVLVVNVFLIFEYLTKTVKIQINNDIKIYSTLVSINTVFGLIFPLFYINSILSNVMLVLSKITNYGTVFCQIRLSIVNFYYVNRIFLHGNNLIALLVITTAILFLFGGFIERLVRSK